MAVTLSGLAGSCLSLRLVSPSDTAGFKSAALTGFCTCTILPRRHAGSRSYTCQLFNKSSSFLGYTRPLSTSPAPKEMPLLSNRMVEAAVAPSLPQNVEEGLKQIGDSDMDPKMQAMFNKELQKKAGMQEYESLKKDMFRLTGGTVVACMLYALVTVSLKAASSYGVGAAGSWLYLRLLMRDVDKLSRESVPEIFRQKKYKRIGVDSRTISENFEKSIRGVGMVLGSTRLFVPIGLMLLGFTSKLSSSGKGIDLEVVPMMLGFFAYKGALLIQTVNDNKDLLLVQQEDEDERIYEEYYEDEEEEEEGGFYDDRDLLEK